MGPGKLRVDESQETVLLDLGKAVSGKTMTSTFPALLSTTMLQWKEPQSLLAS